MLRNRQYISARGLSRGMGDPSLLERLKDAYALHDEMHDLLKRMAKDECSLEGFAIHNVADLPNPYFTSRFQDWLLLNLEHRVLATLTGAAYYARHPIRALEAQEAIDHVGRRWLQRFEKRLSELRDEKNSIEEKPSLNDYS